MARAGSARLSYQGDVAPGSPPPAHRRLRAALAEARNRRAAGDYPAAASGLRRAIAEAAEAWGPDALALVPALNELGVTGKYRGDFGEAEEAYRRALSIQDRHGAAGAVVDTAAILHNLGGLAHASGDAPAAEQWARRGIAIRCSAPPVDVQALAADRAALAAILIDRGSVDEARILLTQVLAGYERNAATYRYEIAVALHNLGSLQHRGGAFADAAATLRRARTLKQAALGRNHPDLAITLYNLARCQQRLGQRPAARRGLRRAITLLEGVVPATNPTLAACRLQLAGA